jgi:hypothetical protein
MPRETTASGARQDGGLVGGPRHWVATACACAVVSAVAVNADAQVPAATERGGPQAVAGDTIDQLRALLAGLVIAPIANREEVPGPYSIFYFAYGSEAASWPYGTGFAVTEPTSGEVFWILLHHGDYPVHTVRWADFDGDGKEDIFFHAGFEDVAETYVYVNRVASTLYALSNFALRFHSREAYALVLDLDGSGRPELLVPEAHEFGDVDDCVIEAWSNDSVRQASLDEYERIVGRFESFNSTFNRGNLMIADKVKIAQLHGDTYWATTLFSEHLNWRMDRLEQLSAAASLGCRPRFEAVRDYLTNPVY